MRALRYLVLTRMKNSLKNLVRHPSRLIFALFMLAILILSIIGSNTGEGALEELRSRDELFAIIFGFYFMMMIISANTGLKNGASFYSMADVNMLFAGPFPTRRILIYGLIRQLGMNVLVAFFLLFQYSWLHNLYGIRPVDLGAIILGYILVIFCSQLLAMGIYSYSSSSPKRQKGIRTIIYAFTMLVVVPGLLPALQVPNKLDMVVNMFSANAYDYIPIAGWLRAFCRGMINGEMLSLLAGLFAVFAFVALFIAVILRMNADFYEDVLAATEVSYSAITAQKEGKIAEAAPQNVKVGKIGIGKGWGASAFYYKHLVENRRSSILLFDLNTMIYSLVSIVFAFFMRENGILPGFLFSCYMTLFSSFTGRWARELLLPYIYMVPQKPFKKLIAACGEHIQKSILEGIFTMVLIGLVVSATIPEILAAIVAKICLSLLFIAATILAERLFGSLMSKTIQLLFYFLTVIILIAPGVVLAILLTAWLGSFVGIVLFIAAWLLLISALVLYLCRNILTYAELNFR